MGGDISFLERIAPMNRCGRVARGKATNWFGHEGDILRYVFFHSIALACLVGIFVMMQAYVWPFTLMVL